MVFHTKKRRSTAGRRVFSLISSEKKLRIPKITCGVAQTFLQRFFARHSFKAHNRLIIAATCVFLAGKAEETRVSLQDIIRRYFEATKEANPTKEKMDDLKERILVSERVLLHTIAFQLSVQLPFPHTYRLSMAIFGKEDEKQQKAVVKTAWTFVADSMKTDLCLQFHEAAIAAACIFMAVTYLEAKIADSEWWKNPTAGVMLDMDGLQTICLQVLETYTGSKPKPKPKPSSANPNAVVEEPLDPDALRKKVLHKVGQFAVVPDGSNDDVKVVKIERDVKRPVPVEVGSTQNGTDDAEQRDSKRVKTEHQK